MQLRCRHCRAARAVLVHPEQPGARVRFPAVGRIFLPVLPSRDERRRRAKHVRPEEPQGGARLVFGNILPRNNKCRDVRGRGSWWPVAAQGAQQRSRRSAAAQQKGLTLHKERCSAAACTWGSPCPGPTRGPVPPTGRAYAKRGPVPPMACAAAVTRSREPSKARRTRVGCTRDGSGHDAPGHTVNASRCQGLLARDRRGGLGQIAAWASRSMPSPARLTRRSSNRRRAGKGGRFTPTRGVGKHCSPGPAGSGWLPLPACQCA